MNVLSMRTHTVAGTLAARSRSSVIDNSQPDCVTGWRLEPEPKVPIRSRPSARLSYSTLKPWDPREIRLTMARTSCSPSETHHGGADGDCVRGIRQSAPANTENSSIRLTAPMPP